MYNYQVDLDHHLCINALIFLKRTQLYCDYYNNHLLLTIFRLPALKIYNVGLCQWPLFDFKDIVSVWCNANCVLYR